MIRVGMGYDVHRFKDGGDVILGGVTIPYEQGLEAHSDGDVVLHALADALLGAAALGDIGQRPHGTCRSSLFIVGYDLAAIMHPEPLAGFGAQAVFAVERRRRAVPQGGGFRQHLSAFVGVQAIGPRC